MNENPYNNSSMDTWTDPDKSNTTSEICFLDAETSLEMILIL